MKWVLIQSEHLPTEEYCKRVSIYNKHRVIYASLRKVDPLSKPISVSSPINDQVRYGFHDSIDWYRKVNPRWCPCPCNNFQHSLCVWFMGQNETRLINYWTTHVKLKPKTFHSTFTVAHLVLSSLVHIPKTPLGVVCLPLNSSIKRQLLNRIFLAKRSKWFRIFGLP